MKKCLDLEKQTKTIKNFFKMQVCLKLKILYIHLFMYWTTKFYLTQANAIIKVLFSSFNMVKIFTHFNLRYNWLRIK